MSFFKRDLNREQILSFYLDRIYEKINLKFVRNHDFDLQHKGVDLSYNVKNETYYIDEKAQLTYINKDLPTFTFELSYLINRNSHKGWLFDEYKITSHYFLITGIFAQDTIGLKNIRRCKVLSVDRNKLILELEKKNLSKMRLDEYDREIRIKDNNGKIIIPELDSRTEGNLFFSKHLEEEPINLQLRLQYLIDIGVGKKIY